MMCQLERPKEKRRRKLALAHAYAYDVEGKLHGVVVETSDSSEDEANSYATPEASEDEVDAPAVQGDSELEAKHYVEETQLEALEGSEDGTTETLLFEANCNPREVHFGDKQDLQSVEPETKKEFAVQQSRPFQLLYEGQEVTHFEFIDNERLRRRFMEAADPRKRETVLMSWIDENEETKTRIRNG